MADIFLSHERTDRRSVAPIVAVLEACGWSVWWGDGTETGSEASEPNEPENGAGARELAGAGCVVAVWSVDAVESDRVRSEADEGLKRGILVSVHIDISAPPHRSGRAPSISLAGWDGDIGSPRAQELIGAVGGVLGRSATAAAPAELAETAEPAEPVATPVVLLEDEEDVEDEVVPIEEDDATFELPRTLISQAEQRPHWERIKDSDDPNELWAFVVAYPTGGYAEAAWERLRELGLAEPPEPPLSVWRSLALGVALTIVLVAVFPATLWLGSRIGAPRPGLPGETVVTIEAAPRPVAVKTVPAPPSAPPSPPSSAPPSPPPSPHAPPQALRIEDLVAQTTPRVERLLAQARALMVAGDICGARALLEVSETDSSGSLSFVMAETYDPNVLPAAHKDAADAARATAFYLKARELGYGEAQQRLQALKAAGSGAALPSRLGATGCASDKTAG